MFKAYKVEIKPTIEQAEKIRQTIGVCRVVYNLFLPNVAQESPLPSRGGMNCDSFYRMHMAR
jgi:putative transposase